MKKKGKRTEKTKELSPFEQKVASFLKNISWQQWVLLAVIVGVFAVQYSVFSQFQHIPGPIYGGDFYREKGFTLHILNGNPFWEDPYLKGEYEFYPPFGYLTAAGATKLFSADLEKVLYYFPLFTTILITLCTYYLGREVFKDETYAVLIAMLSNVSYGFVLYKNSEAFGMCFVLLFLIYFLRLQKEVRRRDQISAGVLLGMVSLTHYKPFLYLIFIILFTLFFELIYQLRNGKDAKKLLVGWVKKYWVVVVIGVLISMIFFGPLIAKYKLKTVNLTNQYSLFNPDINGIGWVLSLPKEVFLNFHSWQTILWSLIHLAGLAYVILNFKRTEARFTLYWFLAIILGAGHYLITRPLFNNWIVPSHIASGMFIPKVLLFIFGAKMIVISLKKVKWAKLIVPGAIVVLLFAPTYGAFYDGYVGNRWTKYGMSMDQMTSLLFGIGDWLQQGTTDNDVFLAHDESAFMINALSGRKVVTVRRTHASPYVDMDQRYADAIVMLYGKDPEVTKKLLKQYGVTYFYMDQYLLSTPMLVELRLKEYIEENGVVLSVQNVRFDPASPQGLRQDAVVVGPQNLTILSFLSEAQPFGIGNQPHSVFYRINQSMLG